MRTDQQIRSFQERPREAHEVEEGWALETSSNEIKAENDVDEKSASA